MTVAINIRTGSGPGSPAGQPGWGGGSDRVKTPVLSAKGAKCNSLGHRPRWTPLKVASAEGAK